MPGIGVAVGEEDVAAAKGVASAPPFEKSVDTHTKDVQMRAYGACGAEPYP